MSPSDRAAWCLGLILLASGLVSARGDEPPKPAPQAADPVDRILSGWQAKAAKVESIEAKFLRTDHDKGWGRRRYQGRAILAAPNLAMAEFTPIGDDGKTAAMQERLVWNGRSIYQFAMDENKVYHFPLSKEWPAAPSVLRLPFFYRMTVEEAKREYRWKLVEEDQDRFSLEAAPLKPVRSTGFRSCLIVLEKATFRPIEMVLTDQETDFLRSYKLVDLKINTVRDTSELTDPCLDAWTVVGGPFDKWLVEPFLR